MTRSSPEEPIFSGSLPVASRAGWHFMAAYSVPKYTNWFATLEFEIIGENPSSHEFTARNILLVRPVKWHLFGLKVGIVFIPTGATRLTTGVHGVHDVLEAINAIFLQMPRELAAIGVCLQNMKAFRLAFRESAGTVWSRLRRGLEAAAYQGQDIPRSYRVWTSFFDAWPERRLGQLLATVQAAGAPTFGAVVFSTRPAPSPALVATMASLRAQVYPALVTVTETGDGAGIEAARVACDYLATLQAGEVVPRHGLLLMAERLRHLPQADILLADEDCVAPDGSRYNPLFKPEPSLTMMCSGVLSRGLWVVRRELVGTASSPWAECARLGAWFRVHAAGHAGNTHRVPHVLTHRRSDVEHAPPEKLAAVVNDYLHSAHLQATALPGFPLRVRWKVGNANTPKVSLLVPSRLTGAVQLSCLLDVLEKTTYANLDMLVMVMQDAPLGAAQDSAARQLQADPRVRVEVLHRPSFNYSLANNAAASLTDGDFICLLNDDISTIAGDWLDQMVGLFSDPGVGVVGAKLYYPNLTTQHGGIIMGLAGLADHANRFLPRGQPSYAWRAEIDQEFSAVTGACLLVRRSVYEKVGGLDESFPTAFNDVDFCLRVRQIGYGVVLAASVELLHHETLSFGSHYKDDVAQELIDVRRMQQRWRDVCKADPFHNPNLSLVKESEWELAFPPRHLKDGFNGSTGQIKAAQ